MPGPTLTTERLLLSPRRVGDAATYRALWTERDSRAPAHRRIDADGRPTVEDVAERIRADEADPEPGLLGVELRATGELLGYCGLVTGDGGRPELAYELLRAHHGVGYATEAARAVLAWTDEHGIATLWATVRDWNEASLRVLAKVGFRETGVVEPDERHGDSLLLRRGP